MKRNRVADDDMKTLKNDREREKSCDTKSHNGK